MLESISFPNANHNCLSFIHDADKNNDPIGSVAFHMIIAFFFWHTLSVQLGACMFACICVCKIKLGYLQELFSLLKGQRHGCNLLKVKFMTDSETLCI